MSAAGRILSQDKDELVNVGRNGDSAEVRFAQGGTYELPNLHQHLEDAPDQISVAVGDLDKIPDANGANHDELVVAYAEYTQPGKSGRSQLHCPRSRWKPSEVRNLGHCTVQD